MAGSVGLSGRAMAALKPWCFRRLEGREGIPETEARAHTLVSWAGVPSGVRRTVEGKQSPAGRFGHGFALR